MQSCIGCCSWCSRRRVSAQREPEKGTETVNQPVFYTAECSVCLDRFEEHQQIIRLNCGHLFHESCVRQWLGVRNACPFCNTAGARESMEDARVALINDPARLHEVNNCIAQG